ncbi:hypothetical protein CRH09_15920 [Nocardia terpenica]|uniref:Uncharacterized protein n=2 Tax=Nocardia terpenica TaxID=455432 RepID=A0A291RJF4_9NOCA|nr:hypothetical protein CRH09_15920 [Nocardia terpenica]
MAPETRPRHRLPTSGQAAVVPIKVRILGTPSAADLARLTDSTARAVGRQLRRADAERVAAANARTEAIARDNIEKDRILSRVADEEVPLPSARTFDMPGLTHIVDVIDTVNWALQTAQDVLGAVPLKQVLAAARDKVTVLRDLSDRNAQSLILRDAERYLWARAGQTLDDLGTGSPNLNRRLAPLVRGYYEAIKRFSLGTGIDIGRTTKHPYSAPGGDPWFELGLQHWDRYDKDALDKVVPPQKPTYSDEIEAENSAAERDDR